MDPDEQDPIAPDTSAGSRDRDNHEDDDHRQPLLATSQTAGSGETIPMPTSTSYREHSSQGTTEQAKTSFI